jgi:hypothetical protein
LRTDGSAGDQRKLKDASNQLLGVLKLHCQNHDGAFDEKLADYVFFPLSNVLKVCQKSPGRLAEIVTRCLQILLEYGWKQMIAVDLAQQLLILLTFFAGGGPSDAPVSEELKIEAFRALKLLFNDIRRSVSGAKSLLELSTIPALGQCLTTVLDGICNGPSPAVQLEALHTLSSLWSCIKDQQALSNFLPATVSTLTKCLNPTTVAPRSRKVLICGLKTLRQVLTASLSDIHTRNLKDGTKKSGDGEQAKSATLTQAWLKATAAQVKLGLATVVKLRSHESEEVRFELDQTCLSLIDECNYSLGDSMSLLVETSMILSSPNSWSDIFSRNTTLKDLATINPSIAEIIKATAYNWIISLPRVLQVNDELSKKIALEQLSKANSLLLSLGMDSGVLNNAFGDSLRNSLSQILESSTSTIHRITTFENNIDNTIILTAETTGLRHYRPLIMPHGSQIETREQLGKLLNNLGSPEFQTKMAAEMLEKARNISGNDRFASFWLSFQLIKVALSSLDDLDDFLNTDALSSGRRGQILEEIYTYAVSILLNSDEQDNWMLLAISLEVVAYASQRLRQAFRADLVDTLYPVVQFLGCSNPTLREHAIVTLNILTEACGYTSTSDLIVQNVDYLVNSVALKLNTFDISPQAPQVLIMMIRLSGPLLLPYLDDVVSSIFASLDNFHGYPQLVDKLFSVLEEIVGESTKAEQLRLNSEAQSKHQKSKEKGPEIINIAKILANMKKRFNTREEGIREDFPRKPWKDAKTLLDEYASPENEDDESNNASATKVQPTPPTKVYNMVQSIARLSQHYLTSSSPHLRLRLLNLLSTASNALQENEDAFLPLVNDIWPVLIKRLYDSEPYVVIGACSAISAICRSAGNFMATRIQTERHDLLKLIRQFKAKAEADRQGKHGRGVHSLIWQVWDNAVGLLSTIVEYVRIEDEMFDEALEIVAGVLDREDVRRAFEAVNSDAVWLIDVTQGRVMERKPPILSGYKFASIEV